tara:strand:- start:541 stop:762 length:222 start_codon:yes stop_codon:yes gene_type:complete
MSTVFKHLASNFNGTRLQLLKLLGIEVEEEVNEEIDYSSLKVSELKAIAKERELKGYSTLKKAALVELLTENG